MATKLRGLLKGLRYISQIFDDEKEPEKQIGFPTDIKHLAHIGWDGPAANSPGWMDNVKPDQDSMSRHLGIDGNSHHHSSRQCSTNGDIFSMDSPIREKSEKTTSSRYSRKTHLGCEVLDNSISRLSSRNQLIQDLVVGGESPSHNLPDIPKKSRRKKSKDSSQGGSSETSSRTAKTIAEASTYNSPVSCPGLGSIPQLRNTELYSCPSPNSHPFNEASDKKFNGFS